MSLQPADLRTDVDCLRTDLGALRAQLNTYHSDLKAAIDEIRDVLGGLSTELRNSGSSSGSAPTQLTEGGHVDLSHDQFIWWHTLNSVACARD